MVGNRYLLYSVFLITAGLFVGCATTEFGVDQGEVDEWDPASENVTSIQSITSADEADYQPKSTTDNKILFSSDRDGDLDVWMTSLDGGGGMDQLTTSSGNDIRPSPHPDNEQFVFISQRREEPEMFMSHVDRPTATALATISEPEFAGFSSPEFSPDGSKIVYASGRHIWVYELETGTRTQMVTGHQPSWHPNGEKIVFVRKAGEVGDGITTSIWMMDSDGTNLTQLISSGEEAAYQYPNISPDSQRIVYTRASVQNDRTGELDEEDIWVADIDGTGATQLTTNPFPDTHPDWLSETRIVFSSARPDTDDIEDAAWNIWSLSFK
jgi:Tol biopolymer transport system component